jgi:hypothetical protein
LYFPHHFFFPLAFDNPQKKKKKISRGKGYIAQMQEAAAAAAVNDGLDDTWDVVESPSARPDL